MLALLDEVNIAKGYWVIVNMAHHYKFTTWLGSYSGAFLTIVKIYFAFATVVA